MFVELPPGAALLMDEQWRRSVENSLDEEAYLTFEAERRIRLELVRGREIHLPYHADLVLVPGNDDAVTILEHDVGGFITARHRTFHIDNHAAMSLFW